jgi:hypothetical protein
MNEKLLAKSKVRVHEVSVNVFDYVGMECKGN